MTTGPVPSDPGARSYLEFLRRFGTNKADATDFTHGIPQMLTMINHPRLLKESKALDAWLKKSSSATPEQVVEWLYLGTLSRRPTGEEQAAGRLVHVPGDSQPDGRALTDRLDDQG